MSTSELLKNTNDSVSNNFYQTYVNVKRFFNKISDADYWGALQTDLLDKNLQVNWANLQVNYENNLLLKEQTFLQQKQTSQLFLVNTQLEQLNDIIAKKAGIEERENLARELVYNLTKLDNQLNSETDSVYIAYQANLLLARIKNYKITTQTFTEIEDKKFFDKIQSNLTNKKNLINEQDISDLQDFLSIYNYYLAEEETFIKNFDFLKVIKFKNLPSNFIPPEFPERPEILDCEKEITEEIENPSENISIFSTNLRSFISEKTQLKDFFKTFFTEKKKYEEEFLKASYFNVFSNKSIKKDSKTKTEEEINDLKSKLSFCMQAINLYLELHSSFLKDFKKIEMPDFESITIITIDYLEKENNYKEQLLKLEQELDNYYSSTMEKLNNYSNFTKPVEVSKKKSLFSFFKKNK